MRGEQVWSAYPSGHFLGSPPRARGTAAGHVDPGPVARITPAYAGNSRCHGSLRWSSSDHPRVRGEQGLSHGLRVDAPGSPPRTRGTVRRARRAQPEPGITPAYAGNRAGPCPGSGRSRDHPRVRGEQAGRSKLEEKSAGSPPRTRGTVKLVRSAFGPEGITPAYAGNSAERRCSDHDKPDHPRVRGEQPFFVDRLNDRPGSPPRTRGTVGGLVRPGGHRGITPAYAGNSGFRANAHHDSWDHPRVRGEQTS